MSKIMNNQTQNERGVALKNHNTELNELLTTRQKDRGRTHALSFGAFATVFVAVASMLIFYGCKKETDFVQTENNLKHKNAVVIDEVLLEQILNHPDCSFNFAAYEAGEMAGELIMKRYVVRIEEQSYEVLITNIRERLDAWIAAEIATGKEAGVFERHGLHIGISAKISVPTNFVIVTEEERQYLEAPIPINEFDEFHFIEQAIEQPDCFFILCMNIDGTLQTAVLSPNTSHVEWYNRLRGYVEIIDISDEPLITGCVKFGDINNAVALLRLLKAEGYKNINVCCDIDKKTITICWDDK